MPAASMAYMKRLWAALAERAAPAWQWLSARSATSPSPETGLTMEGWWPDLDAQGDPAVPAAPWDDVVGTLLSRHELLLAGRWVLGHGKPELAMELADRALRLRRAPATLLAACRIGYEAARLEEASEWADELEALGALHAPAEFKLIEAIRERRAVLGRLARPARLLSAFEPEHRRVINLLAYSLPYTSIGYATRSHGLLGAVKALGWDVRPFTRPGYPADTRDHSADDLPDHDTLDGLRYGRLGTSRRKLGHIPYLHDAADEIAAVLREIRPQLVHAASNYMTALPACLAAHEAGLPFVYEVRGFWDVTRCSSSPAFAGTTEFRYLRLFESTLLKQVDAVITLTEAMRGELIRRGAPPERIVVAPNAVDTERLKPETRDAKTAERLGIPAGVPVIGYVGSMVDYEGLDDLVEACVELRQRGQSFHLLLVGDGLAEPGVRELVRARGLQHVVTFAGRVSHAEVAAIYSLIDICPFPRKPWPVCELVSPLKPLEAMSLEKAVVVSDVAAMAEMIESGVNGWTFEKGNLRDLAGTLARLIADPVLVAATGRQARDWVRRHRTWRLSAQAVEQAYEMACRHKQARSSTP